MHCARCTEISHLMLLSVHVTSVLFLVRLNNFALTTGFYWSYMLLLKLPVLMRSWLCTVGIGNVKSTVQREQNCYLPVTEFCSMPWGTQDGYIYQEFIYMCTMVTLCQLPVVDEITEYRPCTLLYHWLHQKTVFTVNLCFWSNPADSLSSTKSPHDIHVFTGQSPSILPNVLSC